MRVEGFGSVLLEMYMIGIDVMVVLIVSCVAFFFD